MTVDIITVMLYMTSSDMTEHNFRYRAILQPKTASAIVHKKGVAMTANKDTYRIRPKNRQTANLVIRLNQPSML